MIKLNIDLYAAEKRVMSGLKDFQRATVNRIDKVFRNGRKRILVADEVGLGKTLIARGVIAKTAILRYELGDPLFKVVYICSNQSIAGQNLSKLKISDEITPEGIGTSRLSMQHLNIFTQEHDEKILGGYIQLIPLTPDTSFRMTTGAGSVNERALMYGILRRLPIMLPYLKELEVVMKDNAYSAWDGWAKNYLEDCIQKCEIKTRGKYLVDMVEKVTATIQQNDLLNNLIDLFSRIRANGYKRISANDVIGRLRVMFAQISVDLLQPDLVIMDEFQRFKYLINADETSETGLLAKRFFSSNDVKMLLLSATPYKLYSTLEEIQETQVDEHYAEFFNVMNFLYNDKDRYSNFKEVWNNYSINLRELQLNDMTIIEARKSAEDALYGVVCRTERISAIKAGDFIDDSSTRESLIIIEKDILSYVQAQHLLDEIGINLSVPVDFIKSCPYILSFMRDYKIKREIEKYFKKNQKEIQKANKDYLWIKRSTLLNYMPIEAGNSRLEQLKNYSFENKAELLLWIPPSKPYYEAEGVFKAAETFSKVLVFSSWEMVPRMIASLISYEAERKTVGKLSQKAKKDELKNTNYFAKNSMRYPVSRLRFSLSEGSPRAMSLFCLIYPSAFLADCFNPIDTLNQNLSLKDLEKQIGIRISGRLRNLNIPRKETDSEDQRWYYLAPLFLDDENYVKEWFHAAFKLQGADTPLEEDEDKGQKGYLAHVALLNELRFNPQLQLGKMPDDLIEVLTDMALASPAICAARTNGGRNTLLDLSDLDEGHTIRPNDRATQIAKAFLNRLNSPESTAIIELCYGKKTDDAHWKNVLAYCKAGNLQAVFDEYAHILIESNSLAQAENKGERLHQYMMEAIKVHSASYSIDTFNTFQNKMEGKKSWPVSFRTHYAVGFTKGEGNTDKDFDRKKSIRDSFNSPFRPFVLATTSIGQEGLDFHYYCRRIMHWNLPSNPIDLEQREGRINRYKCLAIRQNVAQRYGNIIFKHDIWHEIFQKAVQQEKEEGNADLIPFWCLSNNQDIKIERIVPMYPLSRDISSYERLIKILSLYRLTLGQARQEDLLDYILKNYHDDEELKSLFINLSPFFKDLEEEQAYKEAAASLE